MPVFARVRGDFRLVHEPVGTDDEWELLPEETDVVRRLSDRLIHSTGGTFLITGFRGVGKTTVVRRALSQSADTTGNPIVDITVPLARPVSTTTLLFQVMRRLVDRLQQLGLLRLLSRKLRDELLTAYARTTYAMRQTSTQGDATEAKLSTGGAVSMGKVKVPLPALSLTRSSTDTKATEISFLAYSDTDVEHDFLRIIELLGSPDAFRRRPIRDFFGKVWPRWQRGKFPQIVVVFDEIDKLTEEEDGLAEFKAILGGLKNVLAASGVHYVLVAGVDLHDEWLRESATANSLYRSVFAWQGYVGCSWQAAVELLEDAVADADPDEIEVLAAFLRYRGRGVIRNVLYEMNELIEWDETGQPRILIDGTAEDRVRLLAELAVALEDGFEGTEDSVMSTPSDLDRVKQVSYFTSDWVLRVGDEKFTVADVLDPAWGTPLDSVLLPTKRLIWESLGALEKGGYLVREPRDQEQETQGPAAEEYPDEFSLSTELLGRLDVIAQSSPVARAEFGQTGGAAGEGTSSGEPKQRAQELVGDRYEVFRRLGQGGFGTVWDGFDKVAGVPVAIKILRTPSPDLRQRAIIEAELLERMEGEGVIPFLDIVQGDERVAIITELVRGEDLSGVGRLTPPTAVGLVIDVLATVERLHSRGIIHADLKPSNILIHEAKPVVIDLGTAERIADVWTELNEPRGDSRRLTGTPAYMAPEVLRGGAPSEASDVWAVGLLLLELMLGELPDGRDEDVLANAIGSLQISDMLADLLRRALSHSPERRPSAAAFRHRLRETPEGPRRGGGSNSDF